MNNGNIAGAEYAIGGNVPIEFIPITLQEALAAAHDPEPAEDIVPWHQMNLEPIEGITYDPYDTKQARINGLMSAENMVARSGILKTTADIDKAAHITTLLASKFADYLMTGKIADPIGDIQT